MSFESQGLDLSISKPTHVIDFNSICDDGQEATGQPNLGGRNKIIEQGVDVQRATEQSAKDADYIKAMVATIRTATRRDQWIDTGTDEEAIFVTLRDLSERDRLAICKEYEKLYGISLTDELKREMSGSELDRSLGLLDRKDSSNGDAAHIHSLIMEGNQWLQGRSKADISSVLRDKLTSMSAAEIETVDKEYSALYGKSLKAALLEEGNFDKKSKETIEILLKGSDKTTTADYMRMADIALISRDAEMFQQVMAHASSAARQKYIENGREQTIGLVFEGHWYNALIPSGWLGNVTDTEYRHVEDYLKNGRLSAAAKIADNSSWLGDNEKAIEDALRNISEAERNSYRAAREALASDRQPTPSNLKIYTDLRNCMDSAGNSTEKAAWEAMILYPGNMLCSDLLQHRGTLKDDSIAKVISSIEQLQKDDWKTLQNNPGFRSDMESLLNTFLSDEEMKRVKESFDKVQACKSYEDIAASGRRSIMDSIEDDKGFFSNDKKSIVEALSNLSSKEQELYKTDTKFRTDLDEGIKSALGDSEANEAAKEILSRVSAGQKPAMTIIEKLQLHAMDFNIDEAQVVRDVQKAFRDNPDMQRAITEPRSEADKQFAQELTIALKNCLDASEFERYGKPLVEKGVLPVDVQVELDDSLLHTDRKAIVDGAMNATDKERELLSSTDKTNSAAVEMQQRVFGALDDETASFVKTVLQQKTLSPEDRVRSFVLGVGASQEETLGLLSHLSSKQKEEIFKRYAAKYNSSMTVDLADKVASKDRDEVEIVARSHNMEAAEQLNNILDSHSLSRQGLGKSFVDCVWDGTGFQTDEARNLMVQAMRKASSAGMDLPGSDATTFSMRTLATLNNFRDSKAKLSDVATDIGITAVAIGGSYLSMGASLSLLTKVAAAGAVGAAMKVAGKAAVSGSDYQWSARQVALDGGVGMIYGAMAMLGSAQLADVLSVGSAAGEEASTLACTNIAKLAETSGAQLIKEGGQDTIQQGLTSIIREMLVKGSSELPREAITTLASQVATEGNDQAVKLVLAMALKHQALSNGLKFAVQYGLPAATGTLAGGAAGTLRGAAAWNSDEPLDENLLRIAKTASASAAIGGATAFAVQLGCNGVAATYDAVTSPPGKPMPDDIEGFVLERAHKIGIYDNQAPAVKAFQAEKPTTVVGQYSTEVAKPGEWIVTGNEGEGQWTVQPELFEKIYRKVPDYINWYQRKTDPIFELNVDGVSHDSLLGKQLAKLAPQNDLDPYFDRYFTKLVIGVDGSTKLVPIDFDNSILHRPIYVPQVQRKPDTFLQKLSKMQTPLDIIFGH